MILSNFYKYNNCLDKCKCSKCSENQYVNIEEINYLCKNGPLKNDKCFQLLFNIIESPWKPNNNIIDFKKFHITFNQWSLFLTFIKNPKIINIIKTQDIMKLSDLCNKFGGIKLFDEYLSSKLNYDEQKNNNKKINPKNPKEDNNNLFTWKIVLDSNMKDFNNPEYTCTGDFVKQTAITYAYWVRKRLK